VCVCVCVCVYVCVCVFEKERKNQSEYSSNLRSGILIRWRMQMVHFKSKGQVRSVIY
jgi:hypothetical protein